MTTLKAAPDCLLIEPLPEETTLVLEKKNERRLLRGRVLDIGLLTPPENYPQFVKLFPIKVGMIVHYLSYEGNYDNTTLDNKQYYLVLVKDLRGYEE